MSLKILVDDHIDQLFIDNPELKTVNKNEFEIAVASFANLKYLNGLELEDLIDGMLGEGGDEGIDLCYVFCNGVLVTSEELALNKESHVRVKFFQVKKENSFSTDGFRKTKEGIEEIFDLELELAQLSQIGANADFIRKADLIRKLFRRCGLTKAKFSCEVYYVTIAPELKISEKIVQLAEDLKQNSLNIPFDVMYLGAQQILNLTESVDELIEINFVSQPLEIKERDVDTSGFCGFVNGNDLVRSLLDEEGDFKSYLTDGNVRYFLGEDTTINSSIIETAKNGAKTDIFWAMNNGLTIIGESVSAIGSNQYSITNPQIVNGCQTIHCLHSAFEQLGELPRNLKVFVKIVNTDDPEVQTDIISATNSQNPVKAASLKANDNIQRNIEKHLAKAGIYFERRQNYYKRQGYTGNKVVGLLKMAQVVNTVANKEAIISLNDPGSFFDSAGKYNTLFSDLADYDFYKFAIQLSQKAWSLKNSDLRTNTYDDESRSIISRGGYLFLHAMSSIIMSEARLGNGEQKPHIDNIALGVPARNNEFTKRKNSIFKLLEDDAWMKGCYERARSMVAHAIVAFVDSTQKDALSVFKHRTFDKEFLRPVLSEHLIAS